MSYREHLSIAEKAEISQRVDDALSRIRTRKDLADFVELLAELEAKGIFEETRICNYLSGLSNALHNLHGYCRNQGLEEPKQPDWQWMGRLLDSAFFNG